IIESGQSPQNEDESGRLKLRVHYTTQKALAAWENRIKDSGLFRLVPEEMLHAVGQSPVVYIITIGEAYFDKIHSIAEKLSAAGFKVQMVAEFLGVISGSISPALVDNLRSIEGVEIIAPDREVSIPEK